MTSGRTSEAAKHLPLSANLFHILLTVLGEAHHGYYIIKEITRQTNGRVVLGTSTLYAGIKRLVETGLLEETDPPRNRTSAGPRRRYYRATRLGAQVAQLEALRIRDLDHLLVRMRLISDGARETEGEA